MKFLKKHSFWLISIGIIALYCFTRFYNLLSLPIFTDEAIYIRWSQIASGDAAWRFISLTDGKQPMFVWIAMILVKVVADPLLAGRLVSVLAGFGSLIGLFFLTFEIFKSKKVALLASAIYVLYPFSLVYDRMALYDSLVAMFIIWSLFFEILLIRHLRLDIALILGMIIGGGMLTKTNANFAFILLPALLLLVDYHKKDWKKSILKFVGLSLVSLVIANAMYAILRLSPFFHIIEAKNYVFIYPLSEWLMHPFTYFIPNLTAAVDWLVRYATGPFLVLVAASFLVGRQYWKEKLLLLAWFLVPFLASVFFFKQAYPRFILFMTMPLLVLGTYALFSILSSIKRVWFKIAIVIVFLAMFVINDYLIITDFEHASIPRSDRGQFITGWPAGQGVRETVTYLTEQAKTQKIYVGTEGTFGLMPYALEIYLKDNPNIVIQGFWPINDTPPQELVEKSKTMPTYVVFYQDCPSCPTIGVAPVGWSLKEIIKIEKPEEGSFYTLYQVMP